MSEEYNMSMRKFLKQVGVTSQQAIDTALREAGSPKGSYAIKAVVSIEELGMEHEVTGTLSAED